MWSQEREQTRSGFVECPGLVFWRFWSILSMWPQKREQCTIAHFRRLARSVNNVRSWFVEDLGPLCLTVLNDFEHVVPEAWTMNDREFSTTGQKREQFSIVIFWGPWTTFLAVLSDFKHVVPEAWTMYDREFSTTGQKREQCTIVIFWSPWTTFFCGFERF